jgi:RNA-directed DNA polymerase
MTKPRKRNYIPVTVPFSATPVGETRSIDQWAHPAVWTERMLDTLLHREVRGGKWHTLIDKVFKPLNLYSSARKVLANKGAAGVDDQTVEQFNAQRQEELTGLHDQLRGDTYRPAVVRRTWIPKAGSREKRPLGIPTVRDRVVQTALVHVIEPIFDTTFHDHSFGFRRGRSCHDALRRVEELLDSGYVYVVDVDLKSYFDTIPKDRLMELIKTKISDSRVLKLIQMFLDQGIMEKLKSWTPETGVPQGAVLSPVLSNVYLNPLDHLMAEAGFEMVRYADDFVILCRSEFEAEAALETIKAWVAENGLTLHPTKTQIVDYRSKSFAFLGYSFRGKLRFPRAKSHRKLMDRIVKLTPRKSGESLECILQKINRLCQGWFNYFRHCTWNIFVSYDNDVRQRLRRMLMKRQRRNPLRLCRNQRWQNDYFADHGFRSLKDAHIRLVQSLGGNY